MNDTLLLGNGTLIATGVTTFPKGDVAANWTVSWPEQEHAGVRPITLQAFFGRGFHHRHMRGGIVRDWPQARGRLMPLSSDAVTVAMFSVNCISGC
jgi:hypothetical protein